MTSIQKIIKYLLRRGWGLSQGFLGVMKRPIWRLLFAVRSIRLIPPSMIGGGTAWEELNVHFINLASRSDRRNEVEKELRLIGLENFHRFEATPHEIGIIGCAISHSNLMRQLLDIPGPVMVCEDDVQFLVDRSVIEELVSEFLEDERLDVLCLANNPQTSPLPVSASLSIVNNTQTAACYVVKDHVKKDLADVFSKSIEAMEKGKPEALFAPDILWKRLQNGRYFFAIPQTKVARQRPSFSDIQQNWVDYGL